MRWRGGGLVDTRAIKAWADVASVAVMLATKDYMTGQTISVNGGWYMSQGKSGSLI